MENSRWRLSLLGLLSIFLLFSAATPAHAQRSGRVPTSLRGALVPLNGVKARMPAHPFRALDSIIVRYHDVKAAQRPTPNAQRLTTEATAAQETPTQVLSEAELIARDVPPMMRTATNAKLKFIVYKLSDPKQRGEAIARLRKMPEVRYAEEVQGITLLVGPPNDTVYNAIDVDHTVFGNTWRYQWNLPLIHANEAWDVYAAAVYPAKFFTAATKKTKPGPKIAVIDTGIDYTHPDYINAGGVAGSGTIAQDVINGGQLDLTDGYDFYYDVNDPLDDYGHGTHVSGIAAAATNNGTGISAIGYPGQIMPLKVTDPSGDGDDIDVINAIIWAADHGAIVANISLALNGGYSQGLQDAIDYAWSKNMLVVAAAGNDGVDYVRRYPAACNKVLAVAASGFSDNSGNAYPEGPASYTNSGLYVGIAAPGGDASYWNDGGELGFGIELYTLIWSTVPTYFVPAIPDLDYTYEQGTSMASPHGAGLAILYAAKNGFTQATTDGPHKMVRAIQRGADNIAGRYDGGWTISMGYGRINALATLKDLIGDGRADNLTPPGGVTGQVTYYGTPVENASLKLQASGRKKYSASSKQDGTFRLPNIVPDTYTVTCKYFNTVQTRTIVVESGCDTMATDFAMDAGSTITVTVNPHSITLPLGGTQQFTATVAGSANTNVNWSITVGPGSITSGGLYTAPSGGTTPATATVQASSVADPSKTDSATVYILPTPKTLTFNPNPVTGGSASTATLKLTGNAPAGGSVVNLSSANTSVATVPATVTVAAGSDTATFTVTTLAVASDTSVNISATYGGATLAAALTVKKASSGASVRLNSAGPVYTAVNGNVFAADAYFTGGSTLTRPATIANTNDPTLYQTIRYAQSFGYSIPIANGTYTLKLHFAETNSSGFGVGLRTMDIKVNGTLTYSLLDVFAEAGANTALIKTSTVTVTNGKVDITLAKKAGTNAFINAIEIY